MGLFNKLKESLRDPQYTKPAYIDDPVADCVSWHPTNQESGAFKTQHIVFHDQAKVRVSASLGGWLLCVFFFGLGALALVGGLFGDNLPADLFLAGAGGILMALALVFDRRFSKQLVFDRHKDSIYYEGDDSKSPTRISSVHAIQIIPAYRASPDSGGYSFEINLVLKNGERINVMDHGNKDAIDHDTHILEECLGVPVWESSRHSNISSL